MRSMVLGFADELEKLSVQLHEQSRVPKGMSKAQADALAIARSLHARVGGMSPISAMQESQIANIRSQIARLPAMEWLARALRTGEVLRTPGEPWKSSGTAPMERVLSLAEPISGEQAALQNLAPGQPLLRRAPSIIGDRRAMRSALHAALRR